MAIFVAIALVVMLLVAGLVLDLGHLHVVKDELQNGADACALSGARELYDATPATLDRATAAATLAGNRNRADFQRDPLAMAPGNVTFAESLAGPYARAITAATAYVRCETPLSNVPTWLMWLGGTKNVNVNAVAIARRAPGQTLCALPLAICSAAADASDLVPGTWYSGRLQAGTALTGNYDWIRFPGMSGVSDLAQAIAGPGYCGVGPETVDSEPGVSTGVAMAWNTRFGLYSDGFTDMSRYPPDRTGYAYTPVQLDNKGVPIPGSGSWPNPPHSPPQNAFPDYSTRRTSTYDPYNPTALLNGNGGVQNLPGSPAPLAQALHRDLGQDRRMAYVPVINCSAWAPNGKNMHVIDYACALLLSPVDDPGVDVVMEFRGLRSGTTDCGTTGFPGTGGAPVPALVR